MSIAAWIGTSFGVIAFIAFVAIALWVRRLDADDFPQSTSTLTDDERRALQLGIGLASGNTVLGGH